MPDAAEERVADAPVRIGPAALRRLFTGLMLVLGLGALDQSIVATALPRIASEFGAVTQLAWVATAYTVASTATMPLFGKLSDQFGRRPVIYGAIAAFLAGSVLCGFAWSMGSLILFRAVQGLGAGGLMPLAQIAIADVLSPRERGRYQGLFGGVFAVCSVAGPVLGGFITDWFGWHWIFFLNLPVGAVAAALVAGAPLAGRQERRPRIDYAGAALLAAATTTLLLMLSLGAGEARWLGPLTALLVALLVWRELVAPEPVLPLSLLRNRVVVVASAVLALTSMAIMGAGIFFPLFFQLVLGVPPADSGLLTGPLMLGIVGASIVGGRAVSRTGRYKPFPLAGLAVATLGYALLGWAAYSGRGLGVIEPVLVMLGVGLGLVMPNMTVAVQNGVPPRELGAATAASSYFRSLGGVVGVAGSGALMAVGLQRGLAATPALRDSGGGLLERGTAALGGLPPDQAAALAGLYRHAIAATFLAGGVVAVLAFAVTLFLPAIQLRGSTELSRARDV